MIVIPDSDGATFRSNVNTELNNINNAIPSLSGLMVKASNLSDVASQQTALNNLTDVSAATNEYVLTKDTTTGFIELVGF